MIRPLFVGMLLFGVALNSTAGLAASPADPRNEPMKFEWRHEGPADACGDHCRTWISAIGAITADTAKDFDAFAQDPKVRGGVIVIDSEGGSVLGALALGRSIRRLGMTTAVGKTTPLPSEGDASLAQLSPEAYCESMCGFVLLGGVRRYVPPEAQVLVHQIWLGDRRNDALAATYSAEDLVVVQRDIGRLAQYTVEMGGDIDLLETALRIPPWEPMRTLTRDELTRMRLSTVDQLFEPSAEASATTASPAATEPAIVRPTVINARGWGLVVEGSTTVLARRHPLTVEGDTIGQFDLLLGCGDTDKSLTMTYVESRRSRDAAPQQGLRTVSVAIGRNSVDLPMVPMTLKPSAQQVSAARGTLPVSMVSLLADSDGRALTVSTATVGNTSTVIRVGSSGISENLAKLVTACASKTIQAVAATHASLAN